MRRVIERRIQHDADVGGVGGGDEVCELQQSSFTRVGFAHQRIDLEKVFHCVRAADLEGQARIRINKSAINPVRMDGLKPKPVHAEVGHVVEIELRIGGIERTRAGAVMQIGERAAVVLRDALRLDGDGVQFVEHDVARLLRRDDDGVIALVEKAVVVNPIWIARHLVTRREPIRAALRGVNDVAVLAAADVRHRIRLVIMRVRARYDEIAAGRADAVLDKIAVGIKRGAVAAIDVGEEFHLREIRGVGREQNRERHSVTRHFVHENVRGGVVGIDAVDGKDGLGRRGK